MNVINDYLGYHWTCLLKLKSNASCVLREWLSTVKIQTGKKLQYLVTDNGELHSQETAAWCTEKGITHQFTTPHTSAQNGRVEHLHRTLMNKVRAMHLVTNQGIGPQRTDTEPPCYQGNKRRTHPFGFPTGLGPDGPWENHAVTV